jgi:hypothetical protein
MGESLAAKSADVRIRWKDCPPGAVVRLVADGVVLGTSPARRRGSRCWAGVRSRWCVAEVRDHAGGLLALTNPVRLEAGDPHA